MTRHLAYTALLVCALLVPCACRRSKTTAASTRLAVEFPPIRGIGEIFSNRYVIVSEGGLTSMEVASDSLRPLPGNRTRASPQITLKLDFTIEQDKVTIVVYTIPPESDPLRYADGHKKRLGAFSARLNETVELQELRRIGYLPLTLKIVSAKPAVSTHPTIVSKVPSIQVDLVDEDLQGHTLLLRNVSSHGILAYALDLSGGSSVVVSSFYGRPVIAQGNAKRNCRARPFGQNDAPRLCRGPGLRRHHGRCRNL